MCRIPFKSNKQITKSYPDEEQDAAAAINTAQDE